MTAPYYSDDSVTIYHGEALATMSEMPPGSVDLLLTDAPYSSGGMFRTDRVGAPDVKYRGWSHSPIETRKPAAEYGSFGGDNRDQRAWQMWVTLWSSEVLRLAAAGSHAFMFTDWRQLPAATDSLQLGGWCWQGLIVWDKGVGRPSKGRFRNHLEYVVWATNGQLNRTLHYPSTLISVPTVGQGEREHVTQKPVALLRELMQVVAPADRCIAFDPFMGSGSTLVAAKEIGIKAVGIDADESHCEVAARRCSAVLDFGATA